MSRREGESFMSYFTRNVLMASAASIWAEVLTIPLDTAKVRLQIQKVAEGEKPKYVGFGGTIKTIAAEEGAAALFSGIIPGSQRQFINGGLRIGLYDPIRNMITGPLEPGQNPTILQKIAAGMTTGAIGISVANPTDVVKIRLQAQGRLPPSERPYSGSVDCYSKIVKADGIKGLWIGVGPNIMRNSIINAAELASYDQYKQLCTQTMGLSDGLHTHILCAFGAGANAVLVGSPVDVLKTRLMNKTPGQPTSILGIIGWTLKHEGPGAFYKGVVANFMRIGSWNVAMFVTLEQIKKHFA